MTDLTVTDTMMVADALIEYGFRHVRDDALFERTVEVLRKIDYPSAADALVAYRDSVRDLLGDEWLNVTPRIEAYSVRA